MPRRVMNKKGFTVIELVVVAAIVGIVAFIAVPVIMDFVPNMKLKAAARDVYGQLQAARFEAIKANRTAVIIFNPLAETITAFVETGAAGNNWALDADDTLLTTVPIDPNIDLFATDIPFNTYGYDSRGGPHQAIPSGVYLVQLRRDAINYMGIRLGPSGAMSIVNSGDGGVTWF